MQYAEAPLNGTLETIHQKNNKNKQIIIKKCTQYAEAPLNGTLKTIHQKMPAYLDPVSVHAMGGGLPQTPEEKDAKKPAERFVLLCLSDTPPQCMYKNKKIKK